MYLELTEQVESADQAADLARHVAGLLDEGYTSGHHPGWELHDSDPDSLIDQLTASGDDDLIRKALTSLAGAYSARTILKGQPDPVTMTDGELRVVLS